MAWLVGLLGLNDRVPADWRVGHLRACWLAVRCDIGRLRLCFGHRRRLVCICRVLYCAYITGKCHTSRPRNPGVCALSVSILQPCVSPPLMLQVSVSPLCVCCRRVHPLSYVTGVCVPSPHVTAVCVPSPCVTGECAVIMADPPWDIHMELPYGTMADDEMRNLDIPSLQTSGLIFLWVTGRSVGQLLGVAVRAARLLYCGSRSGQRRRFLSPGLSVWFLGSPVYTRPESR